MISRWYYVVEWKEQLPADLAQSKKPNLLIYQWQKEPPQNKKPKLICQEA